MAHGFTVHTEDANFVDLGTEFFVSANPAKKLSQVDVLSGEVNVVEPASQELLKNLKYRQSARLDSGILKKVCIFKQSRTSYPRTIIYFTLA